MMPKLYAHPFSSYCWKVLIALWENQVRFDYQRIKFLETPEIDFAWVVSAGMQYDIARNTIATPAPAASRETATSSKSAVSQRR